MNAREDAQIAQCGLKYSALFPAVKSLCFDGF